MKKFTMVVHASAQQALADYLRSQNLESFIFSHVEEHSANIEKDAFLSARDKVVGYVPQVRVDLILDGDAVTALLNDMKNSEHSFNGRGRYWVSDISEYGEL
jgi:nitrogen regulatory protein P-II 1